MGEDQNLDWAERVRAWRSDRRVVGAVCACVAVAAAVAWWRAGASSAPEPARASIVAPTTIPPTTSTTISAVLIVDVVGAVRAAGIVRVAAGARVADVIAAAGGATADADLTRLNLAAPVTDGARVAVPKYGEPPPPLDPSAVTGGSGTGSTGTATGTGGGGAGPINVNTATADELDALPGVGPATAAAIVQERERNGPFRSPDDLERVRGIGPAKLEQLRDLVTV